MSLKIPFRSLSCDFSSWPSFVFVFIEDSILWPAWKFLAFICLFHCTSRPAYFKKRPLHGLLGDVVLGIHPFLLSRFHFMSCLMMLVVGLLLFLVI